MSNYPSNIDSFRSKLNYIDETGHTITGEQLNFVAYDATYERAAIGHDNPENIVVKESGVTKTLGTDYTIESDPQKPWVKYIQRLLTVETTWTVDYTTLGDENDADDINALQNSITAIQNTLGVNPQGGFSTVADRLDALLPKSGGTLTGDIKIMDGNPRIIMSDTDDADNDVRLTYDNSAFTIQVTDKSDNWIANMFKVNKNGVTELYYDGVKKLEITSIGIDISGQIGANVFKANNASNTDWSQFIRNSSGEACTLYINQVGTGRILGMSSGTSSAGSNIVCAIENDGTVNSNGGFKTNNWKIEQDVSTGSLKFIYEG